MPLPDSRISIRHWALWFAVVAGLAQAVLMFAARLVSHRLILISDDVVWMAPLANAALFGLAALLVYFATRQMAGPTAARVTSAVFVFLSGFGPALIAPKLHPAAAILLLTGIAIQSARVIGPRAGSVDRIIRRSLPALLIVCVVAGLGVYGSREILARRQESSLPPAPADAPNVVLIVLDTVRAANLSLYGYERATSPNLDQFAGGGVTFDHALATTSWTLPSHASMFTGRLPHEVSADWLTPLDKTHRTLAEALAGQGYATIGIVANVLYTTKSTGLNRGFVRYSDFPRSVSAVIRQSWLVRPLVNRVREALGDKEKLVRKRGQDVTDEFSHWLDSRPAGRPFFAFLNYFDAHEPYGAPEPFGAKFGSGAMPDMAQRRNWSPADIQRSKDAYDGTIAYLDHEVGRLLDDLRARQLVDNTIIIITSDHGEQFGEHGLFDHGNSLYRRVLEVPLVMQWPSKIPAGLRVAPPVSLVDLPATILRLALRTPTEFPGRSLDRYWATSVLASEAAPPVFGDISKGINLPAWQPVSKGRMRSVVLGGVHYILNGDGSEELYDFVNDPDESHNLIADADVQGTLAAARHSINR